MDGGRYPLSAGLRIPLNSLNGYGGCISGKKFFILYQTVLSGQNYLETIFGFGITISRFIPKSILNSESLACDVSIASSGRTRAAGFFGRVIAIWSNCYKNAESSVLYNRHPILLAK